MIDYSLESILKNYAKRLTNLSTKNKSLLLLQLSQEQFMDLHELDFIQKQPSFALIEQLMAQKSSIILGDVHDPRYQRSNEVSKKLHKIARTEKFIEDERGAQDLYVGYPIVQGKFMDGTVVRCPLLFFPVTLLQKVQNLHLPTEADFGAKLKWFLQKREEPVTFNRSFLLAYAYFNQMKIFDNLLEYSFEDFPKNALDFRTQLYELLKVSPINLNFNTELFKNQLINFEKKTKQALEEEERNGELKLYPQAILGIFPQASSFLGPDYDFLLETLAQHSPNISSWFMPQLIPNTGAKVREEKLITPFLLDASQEQIVREVKQGKSLVVQGPPGTGKSQLICNLVADFTARGKNVLVVSHKRAALDVVFQRLRQIGMGNFVGNVHDFKQDRQALYAQILQQIDSVDAYKKENLSLDSIFLERTFDAESRKIDKLVEELQSFKDALFDTSLCGISAKELYLTSNPNAPTIDLRAYSTQWQSAELHAFVKKLQQYEQYEQHLAEDSFGAYFWKKRLSFQHFSFEILAPMQQHIQATWQALQQVQAHLQTYFDSELSFTQWAQLAQDSHLIAQWQQKVTNEKAWKALLRKRKEHRAIRKHQVQQLFEQVKHCFENQGIETTLLREELPVFASKIATALEAKHKAIGGMMWTFFSKEKKSLQTLCAANGLTLTNDDLAKLQRRIEQRIQLEAWWQKWGHLFDVPQTSEAPWLGKGFRWFERHFQGLLQAIEADELWERTALKQWWNIDDATWTETTTLLEAMQSALATLTPLVPIIQQYLSGEQLQQLTTLKTTQLKSIFTYIERHFDALCACDTLVGTYTNAERQLWALLAELPSTTQRNECLVNSMKLAWLGQIEQQYPILRGASSLKLSQLENDLQEAIKQKQALSQAILQMKLREQTYRYLETNRLHHVVTYRELKHQVTKKRKIWSVRKLMAELSAEVFNLIPCWLASPETVSAIFPLSTQSLAVADKSYQDAQAVHFDLIIFDEASQCFAEQGFPSVFRAKQMVIAGDAQQLPPSDLYRVRLEDDTLAHPALEVESFLDLGCQFLPQYQLQGHYRSRSLDLIDFSNQYFYQNSLQMIPAWSDLNHAEPAIQYIKTEGIWQHNCNAIEAEKVVALVAKLQKEQPDKSIGIVTFNYKQQQLIWDLLETQGYLQTQEAEPLFVKNIENVQGDERDIIIFSVAYAPDQEGKFTMNFGALNNAKGENRLNVAITRSREKIWIITSIMPQQLRVEDSQHDGPKVLKKYLEYAKKVSDRLYRPTVKQSKHYWANWLLKEQLKQHSHHYVTELPFADLAVKKHNVYERLILTDDDHFYDSLSVKQTYVYHPLALQQKGWTYERLYSRQFWKKPLEPLWTDLEKK